MNTLFLNDPVTPEILHEKDTLCISLIVPTHRLSDERRTDYLAVKKSIAAAIDRCTHHFPEKEYAPLLQSLNEMFSQIDFDHNWEGVGIYVSARVKQLVRFFLPVKEKVFVAEHFDVTELLDQSYFATPYFLLLLAGDQARLLKGNFSLLREVEGGSFPAIKEDDYEYSRPNRGSSYEGFAVTQSFEREKSTLQFIRNEAFFRRIDALLSNYLSPTTPLLLAGAEEDLAAFRHVTKQATIAGQFYGNCFHLPLNELGDKAWNVMKESLEIKKAQLTSSLFQKFEDGHGLYGVQQVWKATMEGRGLYLLIEKDFMIRGYLRPGDEYHLSLEPPAGSYTIVPDVANALIRRVMERHGTILIEEQDSLSAYQRALLITRY